MLIRVFVIYIMLITTATALHDNTFAVFELKEQLQMLYINMWELLVQLEYVRPDQRVVVYEEIEHIKQQIVQTIDLLLQHDQAEHP
jgi:TATA-binding protein-associated factor Taf7